MMKESKRENQLHFDLPEGIITKILLLLPFESILACKRVSKQWKNLINDTNFCNRYHHDGSLVVFLDENNLRCILLRHNNEIIRNPSYTVHRIPISLNKVAHHQLLSGWSNGIACVKTANGFFILYNLFTGVSHTVKDAPLQPHSRFWIYYGFGYDRYDNDYKIILVCYYGVQEVLGIGKFQNKENSLYWVYSSRNSCWKSFDGFPFALYGWKSFFDGGCYSFNGILHSAVTKIGEEKFKEEVIVTYDIHTRTFGEILVPQPDDVNVRNLRVAYVTELDGRLCCVYKSFDTWFMEVLNGPSVKIKHLGSRCVYNLAYTAFYEWGDNRKVGLLVCDGTLLWYDFSKKEIEEVNVTTTGIMKRKTTNAGEVKTTNVEEASPDSCL